VINSADTTLCAIWNPGRPVAKDRAAVITTSVLQIVCDKHWPHGDRADVAGARAAIESLDRDEIADIEQHIAADRNS
jgi:hypothetical protein